MGFCYVGKNTKPFSDCQQMIIVKAFSGLRQMQVFLGENVSD